MNPDSSPPSKLTIISRLTGWSLVIGGLALSLFAGSITGVGALSATLQEFGFPSGTLCVAGLFLLLSLGSVRESESGQRSAEARTPFSSPTKERPSKLGNSDLRRLEDRLTAELERRHESIREDLQEVSALLEANLENGALSAIELPLAAGGELTSHQLRPAPRKLGPRHHGTDPFLEEDEELEITLEMEERSPDETRLWSQGGEISEPGDWEDRLTGEVIVDHHPYEWNFPIPQGTEAVEDPLDHSPEGSIESGLEADADPEPTVDLDNIGWFDWDEDDLV